MSQELEVQEEETDETGKITVRVLFFGAARDAVGDFLVSFRKHTSSAYAFEILRDYYPALYRFGRSLLFAVNEEYARPEREVFEGDELAVFPSVSGGVA